ncbi:MAG: hypothetical protein M3112_07735 [Actinomycetia bacterium]|nr:hypothetical protein [Actinomycetes bacterium]
MVDLQPHAIAALSCPGGQRSLIDGRAHVPPIVPFSTIATLAPRSRALIAAANAADPDPSIKKVVVPIFR